MDETKDRDNGGRQQRPPCVFEHALQQRCAGCSVSVRHSVSEREVILCDEPLLYPRCARLLEAMRANALFALKLHHADDRLSHSQAMKLQCGGLQGVRDLIEPGAEEVDVANLVCRVLDRWGGFADMPFAGIVQAIAAWKGRTRSRGRPPGGGEPS